MPADLRIRERLVVRVLPANCTRIIWLSMCLLAMTLGLAPLSANADNGKNTRPNILFIMADDHAAHAISAYGSKVNKTPNIDRIAKEGMRFDNCFVVNSICTPSRAAILTGKYSHINGVTVFNRFDGNQPTVAKMLQAAGYHTGMVGKWHLESDPTGFDYWNVLPGQGKYHDPDFIEMGTKKRIDGYATDIITDLAIDFLKNRPADKPFFLMCHHKAPHRPWQPDEKHAKMYEDVTIPEPETFNDDYQTRSSAAVEATMRIDRDLTQADLKQEPPAGLSGQALKKWKYQRYMKDYLRCIASVDDNVGRLLKYLDESGLAENTIVIYTSDQGFFLGDHDWFDKRFMYEESLRMPFMVRFPKHIKPGTVNKDMILNVDFAPTFLQYAGLDVPKEIQGRSILPLLQGKTPKDWRTTMYYRYYHYPADHRVQPHYGVRSERYKLIYFNKINEWEFFDLKKDPHELKNVYADPAYAKEVQRTKQEMERLRNELNDHDQYADKPPKFVTSVQ
jgi:arylsulfatase A-like enzyme